MSISGQILLVKATACTDDFSKNIFGLAPLDTTPVSITYKGALRDR